MKLADCPNISARRACTCSITSQASASGRSCGILLQAGQQRLFTVLFGGQEGGLLQPLQHPRVGLAGVLNPKQIVARPPLLLFAFITVLLQQDFVAAADNSAHTAIADLADTSARPA